MKEPGDDGKSRSTAREVDVFTAHLAIIDFIDNVMPQIRSPILLKSALVIWRKTHGFGKISEEIGATELARRTKVDRSDIKKALQPSEPHEMIGFRVEPQSDRRQQLRTVYSFPIPSRVREQIAKAAESKAAAKRKNPPTPGGDLPPLTRGETPPTQSEVYSESCSSNPVHARTSDYLPMKRDADSESWSTPETHSSNPRWNDKD